jgi:Ni2+-binding GTPase involved in maturation of urease and hydrogenase
MQGVDLPEGQDMLLKPFLKKMELFIVHKEDFVLGRNTL